MSRVERRRERNRGAISRLLTTQAVFLLIGLVGEIAYTIWTAVHGPHTFGEAFLGVLLLFDVAIALVLGAQFVGSLWLLLRQRQGTSSWAGTVAVETFIAVPCLALAATALVGRGAAPLYTLPFLTAVSAVLVVVLSAQ